MKVLSILQPWASLVVLGHKKIETRSWNTKYRGPLLIHASQGKQGLKAIDANFWDLCNEIGFNIDTVPFGAIIGQVNLEHTLSTDKIQKMEVFRYGSSQKWHITKQETAFGDYTGGRYGWLLSNPVQFPAIIPAKGQLGIWEYDMPEKIGFNLLGGGHASFNGMPDKQTVEALEKMVEVAKQSKLFK